jgi:hypothetical protein
VSVSGSDNPRFGTRIEVPYGILTVTARSISWLKVYPNPNKGIVTIERESDARASIKITDLTGKMVYECSIEGNQINSLDLSNLQNGIYLLQIDSERFKILIGK